MTEPPRIMMEVVAYFADKESHLAPSEIDVVMGLPKGRAHDLICLWWREWNVPRRDYKGMR